MYFPIQSQFCSVDDVVVGPATIAKDNLPLMVISISFLDKFHELIRKFCNSHSENSPGLFSHHFSLKWEINIAGQMFNIPLIVHFK
jgi:hypothetical protein